MTRVGPSTNPNGLARAKSSRIMVLVLTVLSLSACQSSIERALPDESDSETLPQVLGVELVSGETNFQLFRAPVGLIPDLSSPEEGTGHIELDEDVFSSVISVDELGADMVVPPGSVYGATLTVGGSGSPVGYALMDAQQLTFILDDPSTETIDYVNWLEISEENPPGGIREGVLMSLEWRSLSGEATFEALACSLASDIVARPELDTVHISPCSQKGYPQSLASLEASPMALRLAGRALMRGDGQPCMPVTSLREDPPRADMNSRQIRVICTPDAEMIEAEIAYFLDPDGQAQRFFKKAEEDYDVNQYLSGAGVAICAYNKTPQGALGFGLLTGLLQLSKGNLARDKDLFEGRVRWSQRLLDEGKVSEARSRLISAYDALNIARQSHGLGLNGPLFGADLHYPQALKCEVENPPKQPSTITVCDAPPVGAWTALGKAVECSAREASDVLSGGAD